jgi:integrase
MLPPGKSRWATEKGETVARPRWQKGCLFKRGKKSPMWIARIREDAIADDGLIIRRRLSVILGSVCELSKREAQRLLSERLGAINQGKHRPELRTEFGPFVTERWELNMLPVLRYSTARNYRHLIRRHLLPFFQGIPLPEITPVDVQMFLADKSKRFAPKTVLSLRNLLSKIFGTAQKWGYLVANPARGAQVPTLTDTRERLALNTTQVQSLLAELSEPYRTMVVLAVLSGLRRGEIFGLRWKSVDFVQGRVFVIESNYEGRQNAPKTRASRRMVFLDDLAMSALSRIKPSSAQPDEFVFHTERGTPLNPNNVLNRILHPACERAGIPRVSWHNFRYTYSTWANPTGESIKALQAQLGHTDPRVTLSVYTQPMPDAQRQIARKVARVLDPVGPKSVNTEQKDGGLIQ